MLKSSDEYEFWPDWTTNSVPFHMTCMRAWTSSNFGLVGPQTAELAALERLKNPHRLKMGKMMSPLFLGCSGSDPFHTCR